MGLSAQSLGDGMMPDGLPLAVVQGRIDGFQHNLGDCIDEAADAA